MAFSFLTSDEFNKMWQNWVCYFSWKSRELPICFKFSNISEVISPGCPLESPEMV